MTARIRRARIPGELLAHVPVHRARERERGFDQAALLAAAVGARLGVPSLPLLARSAVTIAQHALGREARASNVGGAFEVAPRFRTLVADRRVILVDDIVTTGATMGGCAAALLESGARSVWGVAVARDR
jgi:predicted amidophosphoribosyltransferase